MNKVSDESIELDAKESQVIPAENYISLLRPTVTNGNIPITDSSGRLLSIDRLHVTRFGAIFFGQKVLLGSRFGQIMKQWSTAPALSELAQPVIVSR